jgi:TM2 domain-containing membrane protein YozV
MKYYILIGDKTGGPYTIEQVKALYNAGTIGNDNLYATTESQDWLAVSMLVPLFNIPSLPSSLPTTPSIVINNNNNTGTSITGAPIGISHISRKSRTVYQVLAFFLGSLGIHNFYAGFTGRGATQLLITILTAGYGAIISWIWACVEIFVQKTDVNNIPMV